MIQFGVGVACFGLIAGGLLHDVHLIVASVFLGLLVMTWVRY